MNRKRLAGALILIAALGTGGFFAGRFLLGGGGTTAQQPKVVDQLSALQTQEAQTQAEPRFVGQLSGIYIAPSLDQLPSEVQAEQRLISGGCQGMPIEQASTLNFPRPLVMPSGYVLSSDDPANTGSNPGALACSGRLASVGWGYTTAGAEAIPATVSIVRSVINYDTQDVAKSQVSAQTIGGREAVIVRPASSSGLAQRYLVYFPEPFGMTSIQTFNLSEAEVLKVAEAVGGASR